MSTMTSDNCPTRWVRDAVHALSKRWFNSRLVRRAKLEVFIVTADEMNSRLMTQATRFNLFRDAYIEPTSDGGMLVRKCR